MWSTLKVFPMIKYIIVLVLVLQAAAVNTETVPKSVPPPTDKEVALLLLKRWEGLTLTAKWDVNASRGGWGTKSKKGEIYTLEKADRDVQEAFDKVCRRISKKYPKLSNWEVCIFSVTSYNVGTFGPKMDKYLKAGQIQKAAKMLPKYCKSRGKILRGLQRRRADEKRLLLSSPRDRYAIAAQLQVIVNKHIQNG